MDGTAEKLKNGDFSWIEGVVLDLDGTLVDSAPDLAAALNLVLEMKDLQPLPVEEVQYMIGAGVPKLIERGFRARGVELHAESLDAEILDAFLSYYNAHAADLTKVYPGAYDLLEKLVENSVKVGMCTNKPTEATREILANFMIEEFFDSVIGGTSGFPKKPDPAGLLACLDEMGTTKTTTLYIGDSATDVKLARNAGLTVAVMTYGYDRTPADELGADLVIESFKDLIGVFTKASVAG